MLRRLAERYGRGSAILGIRDRRKNQKETVTGFRRGHYFSSMSLHKDANSTWDINSQEIIVDCL